MRLKKHLLLRFLGYLWASPNTAIGLLFALFNRLSGGHHAIVSGVLEIHGPLIRILLKHIVPLGDRTLALTIGHVVVGADHTTLRRSRAHERIHVKQYEIFGPFFIPLYFFATLIAWSRGKRPYRDNWFEIEAYSKSDID